MLDNEPDTNNPSATETTPVAPAPPARRRAASRPAGPPTSAKDAPPIERPVAADVPQIDPPVVDRPDDPPISDSTVATGDAPPTELAASPAKKSARKAAAKRPAKKSGAADPGVGTVSVAVEAGQVDGGEPTARAPRKRVAKKAAAAAPAAPLTDPEPPAEELTDAAERTFVGDPVNPFAPLPPALAMAGSPTSAAEPDGIAEAVAALLEAVPEREPADVTPEIESDLEPATPVDEAEVAETPDLEDTEPDDTDDSPDEDSQDGDGRRRRRRRGGRRRRRTGADDDTAETDQGDDGETPTPSDEAGASDDDDGDGDSETQRRRRRRRRRRGEDAGSAPDDPTEVVVRVREPRRTPEPNNEVTGIEGSTRMEAKRQRRRDGREAGRRRPPILSEAEFLARREAVSRKMIIRQRDDLSQIAVLEDDILVEHYVDRDSAASLIGNVYLGRVQNVLPSMEAAFIDIGRGRNAVLYAGEVDWDSFGAEGQGRKVERVLKSGQPILVQVSKDPIGAKGARLTNHVSIPGRYIVYAPGGHLSGISRKLPDIERKRLRDILADLVGESASVIVRTAAEGASEDELIRDVNRLQAQWADIERKVASGTAPQLLYGEPDLTVRIVRDLFTEDFSELIIAGNGQANDAYDAVDGYVTHVAPHLKDRLRAWDGGEDRDLFGEYRLDEQIAKALERKVFLPSGGSLVIDRTEAMTVIDVNTGKFTGSGGNLEATVTSNNLEAAEEIVRQLRLRDIGGIIVIDFIDMVLPNNRELLLRRLVECLSRDRTRHQVAEVTSLGLVQMTRKKLGTGLLEAFTTECPVCHGRGVEMHDMPVDSQQQADGGTREPRPRDQRRGGGSGGPKPTEPRSPDGSDGSDPDSTTNGGGARGGSTSGSGNGGSPNSEDRGGRGRRGGGRSRRGGGNREPDPGLESGSVTTPEAHADPAPANPPEPVPAS